MLREFPSLDIARRTFDAYARLDPRLMPLWNLCRRAAPPVPANDEDIDPFDVDVFTIDILAAGKPHDGWCAEDFFFQNVKQKLETLVGMHRQEDPPELRQERAYHEVYSALFYHALHRPCACCRGRAAGRRLRA